MGGFDGEAGDGGAGFVAVGEARCVPEIDEVGAGEAGQERAEDGEAAEAGVEDTDDGTGGGGWVCGTHPS